MICEATGTYKDTASSVAFLVEYYSSAANSTVRLATVIVDCVKDPYGPTSHSFYPTPSPGARGRALNTARSITTTDRGTTLIDNESLFTTTFDTIPMFQCGQCEAGREIYTNPETRCTSKLKHYLIRLCNSACK